MADFPQLPPELLLHIFFEVQRKDRDSVVPYARLCVISRVCRAWRVPAQTALYHDAAPRLRARHGGTKTASQQLLDTLQRQTDAGRSLPRAVVALEIRVGLEARDCGVNTLTRHANMEMLMRLIVLSPNLRTLRLRLHEPSESTTLQWDLNLSGSSSVRQFSQHDLRQLQTHRSITHLAVDAMLYGNPPVVAQLRRIWPQLTHVHLAQRAFESSPDVDADFDLSPPSDIRSLSFRGLSFTGPFDLACATLFDLQALSLDEIIDVSCLVPFQHCLRSLHLGRLATVRGPIRGAHVLRGFTCLERVGLGDVPPASLPSILEALPPSVRHIALLRSESPYRAYFDAPACQPTLAVLRAHPPAPGSLRLSLVEDDQADLNYCSTQWRPLLMHCKESGVQAEVRQEKEMWWRIPEFEFMKDG